MQSGPARPRPSSPARPAHHVGCASQERVRARASSASEHQVDRVPHLSFVWSSGRVPTGNGSRSSPMRSRLKPANVSTFPASFLSPRKRLPAQFLQQLFIGHSPPDPRLHRSQVQQRAWAGAPLFSAAYATETGSQKLQAN